MITNNNPVVMCVWTKHPGFCDGLSFYNIDQIDTHFNLIGYELDPDMCQSIYDAIGDEPGMVVGYGPIQDDTYWRKLGADLRPIYPQDDRNNMDVLRVLLNERFNYMLGHGIKLWHILSPREAEELILKFFPNYKETYLQCIWASLPEGHSFELSSNEGLTRRDKHTYIHYIK